MPDRDLKLREIQYIDRSVVELREPAHAVLRKLREASKTRAWAVYVTDGPRSTANQRAKYGVGRALVDGKWMRTGRTVTDAPPELSYHCRAAAVDYALILAGVDMNHDGFDDWLPDAHPDWNLIGQYAKEEGLEWGGDFKRRIIQRGKAIWVPNPDKPHVQLPGALQKYPMLP